MSEPRGVSLEEQELIAGPPAPEPAPDPAGRPERPAGVEGFRGVVPPSPAGASDSFWSFGGPPRAARRRRFAEEND